MQDGYPSLRLDNGFLASLRRKAMRAGVWFRMLTSIERCLVNVAIKVVDKPKSEKLIMALARIVVKVKSALITPIKTFILQYGHSMAKKISEIAINWGNHTASEWAEDTGFIKYLAIMFMNSTSNRNIMPR